MTQKPAASTPALPVAFVTGAAQGIGLATVERLARDGFSVVAMDRNAEPLRQQATRLAGLGLDVVAAPVDVCDRAAVVAALDAQPRIDAMVCAAGIYNDAPLLDLTEDVFRRMLDVNVVGTFIPAQEAARRMQAGGRIVTVSSRGALGGTRFAHYVASKAAVIGLTRAMAMELRGRSFRKSFRTLRTLVRALPHDPQAARADKRRQRGAADYLDARTESIDLALP